MLATEADVVRALSGTYSLGRIYALCELRADVSRAGGLDPVPGHAGDVRWKHRVRGALACLRRAGGADRIGRTTWAIYGTPQHPVRLLLIVAGATPRDFELRLQAAADLLAELDEPAALVLADPPWGLGRGRGHFAGGSGYRRDCARVLGGYVDVAPDRYAVILRTSAGPTGRTPSGPAKIVCEEVLAPPGAVVGSDEKGSARHGATSSGPTHVGPEEVGAGEVGPPRLGEVGPRTVRGNRYAAFTAEWVQAAAGALRPGGQLAVVTGPQRAGVVQCAAEQAGLTWVCSIAARKEFPLATRRRPAPSHFVINVACRGRLSHPRRVFHPPADLPPARSGRPYPLDWWPDNGSSARRGLLRYDNALPLRLVLRLVRAFSDEGEHVVVPFLGSGTEAIACWMTRRRLTAGDVNPAALRFTAARLLDEHAWPADRQPALFPA